jgi:hypothetical protein
MKPVLSSLAICATVLLSTAAWATPIGLHRPIDGVHWRAVPKITPTRLHPPLHVVPVGPCSLHRPCRAH